MVKNCGLIFGKNFKDNWLFKTNYWLDKFNNNKISSCWDKHQ